MNDREHKEMLQYLDIEETKQVTNDIFENLKGLPEMKRKIDIMFDHMGNLTEDVEMLKETVSRHEAILQQK